MIRWIETLNIRSGGTTRRPDLVVASSPAVATAVTKDAEATVLSEIVPSSEDEAQTEVVDSDEPSDCVITELADIEASGDAAQNEIVEPSGCMIAEAVVIETSRDGAHTTVVDIEEPVVCMTTEVVVVTVPATGVQRIESILRDSLRVAWVELCSFVEGKSYEDLLVEEEGIMASFEALMRFSMQDLSSQGKELKAIFSIARDLRGTQCGVVPLEVHDRFTTIRIASAESSTKL
ncbi:hypothetical protein LIER_19187 [Lithospermum erythrorhizon]|uniref:Uncharacterized protein n=1 Tax=Lithospermum erythrorhizon TaxID=34254 RepID=A0AAV3QM92_LITER